MHDGLAVTLAERAVEASTVVLRKVVSDKRLTTKLVHTLKDLVPSVHVSFHVRNIVYLVGCCVSETGEQRKESARDRGRGRIPKDDLVQV